ncbi:hypothetical protein VTK73DRAFT_4995 [Phialemonium thermophilum]|uniref:Uncharacterized protein n=1 Tax=Phialemonium thermophilum TaxID=223376 RepID=A0ABR3WQX0_9PEZI
MQVSRRPAWQALAALLAFASYAGAFDCSAPQISINSQQDATALGDCGGAIDGNITLGSDASGEIVFKNLNENFRGSIVAQDNDRLTRLTLKGDSSIQTLFLQNLRALARLSFSDVSSLGGILIFKDLPALTDVDLSSLQNASGVQLQSLPSLHTLLLDPNGLAVDGNLNVQDIGADTMDALLETGSPKENVSIAGIPRVKQLSYSLESAGDISIAGDGALNLTLQRPPGTRDDSACTIASLTVSGLLALRRSRSDGASISNLTIGAFTVRSNAFEALDLDVDGLARLYVLDNEHLSTLSVPPRAGDFSWREIIITGNPKLRLNSSAAPPKPTPTTANLAPTWVWPRRDVQTMVFEGPFDNSFFKPFVDLGKGSKRPKVLQRFFVSSTLGQDEFDCSALDDLRKAGVLQGEYSCQHQTVPGKSDAGRILHSVKFLMLCLAFTIFAMLA